MRLFVALDLPDALREACAEQADALRDPLVDREIEARFADPERYHLTIRFIGECEESEKDAYVDALSSVEAPPAVVSPYGLSVLPSRLSPRVVTVGAEQTRSMQSVYTSVSEALEAAGLDEADKSFRPHVTLARLTDADPEEVHHALRDAAGPDLPETTIPSLTLYRSHLGDGPTRHEVLQTFALNG
jgi:2'-5' RNA ligase